MRRALIAALLASPAIAEPVVVSPQAETLSVTVYRDPYRREGGIDLDMLGGYALITENRTLSLPAGRATIRFEGVAGGIMPVSAIVQGLPGGVIEKNRDRALLSPAALLDGSLGRHVVLRRTSPATGKVSEEPAIIRSGSAGAVVLETKGGIEALRCSGLPETVVYDAVPEGLSAMPTLSVETESSAASTVKVRLSYLASDFDWAANYVVRVAEDGNSFDLFAWLTLANANGESFPDAQAQAVAGMVNREDEPDEPSPPDPAFSVGCWPMDSTGTHDGSAQAMPVPPPPPMVMMAPAMARMDMAGQEVIVTAQKRAEQEELGDLKLYRLPEAVTIGANSQKQVAMIEKANVPFDRIHRFQIAAEGGGRDEPLAAAILLRTRNKAERHLGIPMPSGGVAIFQGERLVGEDRLRDVAVGEEVEIGAGSSSAVQLTQSSQAGGRESLTLSNANPFPVSVEVELLVADARSIRGPSARLGERNGRPTWKTSLPANGSATLDYRVADD